MLPQVQHMVQILAHMHSCKHASDCTVTKSMVRLKQQKRRVWCSAVVLRSMAPTAWRLVLSNTRITGKVGPEWDVRAKSS